MTQENWARIPEELKLLDQWAVAGADKAPMSIDHQGKLYRVAVNRTDGWLSYQQAMQLAQANHTLVTTAVNKKGIIATQTGLNIGLILSANDLLSCIDLDVKDGTTNPDEPELWTRPEQFDLYWNIAQSFDSYTELSRSGKGLHLWLRGNIGPGNRRDGVEVYSQERFIICTGNVLIDKPVQDRQDMLLNMISQMRPSISNSDSLLYEEEEEEQDWSILERAINASNSDKFSELWAGRWIDMGFPSQSEADLALMSMLAFYSRSNAQCRRLFRDSKLGKREKAQKNDRYINLTLKEIRARQSREKNADLSAIMESARTVQELAAARQAAGRSVTSLHAVGQGNPAVGPPPAAVTAASLSPISRTTVRAGEEGLPWPPGFAGHVAHFIYQSAPRPVKEVAIVAALGLLAGITGKAWHIPQSGLNLYMILVARSAVGKEAMHSGISAIIKACSRSNPVFHKFIDFTEYASGPALIKACVANPCFVNVSGEWGRKLKRLAQDDGRDGALQTLRTQMTNMYQKSGPAAIVGGIGYSSTDNNVASVAGVSYSMIGETTPGTFYEALTESMMEDGFLSRFTIVEYQGERPPENDHRLDYPDSALVNALNNLSAQADMMIMKDESLLIGRDEAAAALMHSFNLECDQNINQTNDESRRQMWNRAALKSLRLAGLLAVSDNWITPCIREEHIAWAQMLVRQDIEIMQKRLASGDVGRDDSARERKLSKVMADYLLEPVPKSYKVPDSMRQNSIVPRSYLLVRIKQAASFYNHKMGAVKALDETIQSMMASGYLIEVQRDKAIEAYNYHGKAFRIVRLPELEELTE